MKSFCFFSKTGKRVKLGIQLAKGDYIVNELKHNKIFPFRSMAFLEEEEEGKRKNKKFHSLNHKDQKRMFSYLLYQEKSLGMLALAFLR